MLLQELSEIDDDIRMLLTIGVGLCFSFLLLSHLFYSVNDVLKLYLQINR